MNCSMSHVVLMIQVFYSRHITARGQFAGLLERLPMPRSISTRDWQFMMKFYMRNYAFSIKGTIRLLVVCRLRRFCSGFSAIQRKGYA